MQTIRLQHIFKTILINLEKFETAVNIIYNKHITISFGMYMFHEQYGINIK